MYGGSICSSFYHVYHSNYNTAVKKREQTHKTSVFAGSICRVCNMCGGNVLVIRKLLTIWFRRLSQYHKKGVTAYFTVEAALIIPIVMLFTTIMIFLAFYSYDRCILEHSAYEAALRGTSSHIKTADEAQVQVRMAAGRLVEEKLFAVKDFNYSISVDADYVTVSYHCMINMPFVAWIGEYVSDVDVTLDISRSAKRYRQTRTIRDFRICNGIIFD